MQPNIFEDDALVVAPVALRKSATRGDMGAHAGRNRQLIAWCEKTPSAEN